MTMTPVLQLERLDRRLLRPQEATDFSELAHAWNLITASVQIFVDVGGVDAADDIDRAMGDTESCGAAFTSESVRRQALDILARIRETLPAFDLSEIPTLSARQSEADESATIEWRFPDRRFAFTIEVNEQESAWHHVSSQRSGGYFAVGKTSHLDLRRALALFFGQDPK